MNQMTNLHPEDGTMFFDAASRFAAQEYGIGPAPHHLAFSRERLAKLGELGILGLGLPEDRGGFGGAREAMLALQALGPALPPEPIIEGSIIAAILLGHDPNVEQDLLDAIVVGDLLATSALEEPDSVFAEEIDGQWLLKGQKTLIRAGDQADAILVSAKTAAGIGYFWVMKEAKGVMAKAQPTLDLLPRADVTFDQTPAQKLDVTSAAVDLAIDRGRAAYLAEILGILDALIRTTIDYAKIRKQFGQAIGQFQSISHRIADMWIAAEETRSLVLASALACDTGTPEERSLTISSAMLIALDAARKIGAEAIQIHGGIGMTEELIVGHWYRRLWALSQEVGDRDLHLNILMKERG